VRLVPKAVGGEVAQRRKLGHQPLVHIPTRQRSSIEICA
jgi:hypothetical protein